MQNQFLAYLKKHHRGQANAVFSKELERIFDLKNREIRLIVNNLRHDGHPICSSGDGYYYARDETEVLRAIHNLNSRIKNITKAKNGLAKSLHLFPSSRGQMSLLPSGGDAYQ